VTLVFVTGGRAVSEPCYSQRAQCLRLSERFFHYRYICVLLRTLNVLNIDYRCLFNNICNKWTEGNADRAGVLFSIEDLMDTRNGCVRHRGVQEGKEVINCWFSSSIFLIRP